MSNSNNILVKEFGNVETVDWAAVESEYICTNVTYKTLAKRMGIPASTVSEYARLNGWVRKREEYRADIAFKAISALKQKEVRALTRHLESAAKIAEKLDNAIVDTDLYKHVYTEKNTGVKKTVLLSEPDSHRVKELSNAHQMITRSMLELWGANLEALKAEHSPNRMTANEEAKVSASRDATIRIVTVDKSDSAEDYAG